MKTYKNLTYQGTYELDFLNNFYDSIDIENSPSIKYVYENKMKIYYPDFYLPKYNLIVEIKSNYIYKLHEKQNIYKNEEVLKNGYNFIFIIDKNYENFMKIII